MGKKPKISKQKVKMGGGAGIDDPEIYDIFNKLVGAGELDMHICYPIYSEIGKILASTKKATDIIIESNCFGDWTPDFRKFSDQISKDIIAYFAMELSAGQLFQWEQLSDDTKKEFKSCFEGGKECPSVINAISVANNVQPFADKLDIKNIKAMTSGCTPFSEFSTVDLYHMFLSCSEENAKTILLYLNKINTYGIRLYKQVRKPTIDTDEFATMIKSILKKVKKSPQLHRLDKAFKLLDKSTDLLDTNFADYYRDFTETGNPTSILQSYIMDVANESTKDKSIDLETLGQLKKIINHFKKVKQQGGANVKHNKQLDKVFEAVSKQFDKLDSKTNNLSGKNNKK